MGPIETSTGIVAAALVLAASAYVHYRLPFHVRGTGRVALTRGILLLTGLAVGLVLARFHAAVYGVPPLLAFAAGFGLVHVPAAVILYIKRERGSGKT